VLSRSRGVSVKAVAPRSGVGATRRAFTETSTSHHGTTGDRVRSTRSCGREVQISAFFDVRRQGGKITHQPGEHDDFANAPNVQTGGLASTRTISRSQQTTLPKLAKIVQQGKVLDFVDVTTQRNENPEEYGRQDFAKIASPRVPIRKG
jgi:hypothetical protein